MMTMMMMIMVMIMMGTMTRTTKTLMMTFALRHIIVICPLISCVVDTKCCLLENNCTYNDPTGRSYMGKKYRTVSNKICTDWSNQRAYAASHFPDGDYRRASNYCRNPRPYEDRTWCYWSSRQWDFCLLDDCGK